MARKGLVLGRSLLRRCPQTDPLRPSVFRRGESSQQFLGRRLL